MKGFHVRYIEMISQIKMTNNSCFVVFLITEKSLNNTSAQFKTRWIRAHPSTFLYLNTWLWFAASVELVTCTYTTHHALRSYHRTKALRASCFLVFLVDKWSPKSCKAVSVINTVIVGCNDEGYNAFSTVWIWYKVLKSFSLFLCPYVCQVLVL